MTVWGQRKGMSRREWHWRFDVPPDVLWPALSDTNRVNEALGLKPYVLTETPRPDGTVRRTGEAKVAGFDLAWEELPYEWAHRRMFRQKRIFSRGPFRRFGPTMELQPDGVGGSTVSYTLEWEPLTLVGRLFGGRLARQAGELIEARIQEAAAFLKGARPTMFEMPAPTLSPGATERAKAAVAEIERGPYGHGLAARLARTVATDPDSELVKIRPKELARRFGVTSRVAIELCLAATKAGLLEMRWELLCPSCRGGKAATPGLDELPRGAHCPSCNIDFDRDFERNVELAFQPAAAIRPMGVGGYCLSGPGSTRHVLAQQLLAPGERREVLLDLPPGRYRLRTLHPSEPADVEYEGGPFPSICATGKGVMALLPGALGTVTFENALPHEAALLIETREWTRDALTAHEVTTLQAFRDLFSAATLRPGDDAGVGRVAILFSDLRGSTELYERIGDAPAYNLVREHFAILAGVVRDHDGAVVKTIGDAVMAVFADPANTVAAALEIQRRIAALAGRDVIVKLGVHAGPCIAVTLNDRLDYFGGTVNLAARLQGQSQGGDVVLSRSVADDPAVRPLIDATPRSDERVELKGFAEPTPFVRLTPAA